MRQPTRQLPQSTRRRNAFFIHRATITTIARCLHLSDHGPPWPQTLQNRWWILPLLKPRPRQPQSRKLPVRLVQPCVQLLRTQIFSTIANTYQSSQSAIPNRSIRRTPGTGRLRPKVPKSPHLNRAFEQRHALTPGRRKSRQFYKESPRDWLRELSRSMSIMLTE